MEIEQTIKAKPEEAKSVNSVYIFIIKQDGKPVKRWRKYTVHIFVTFIKKEKKL